MTADPLAGILGLAFRAGQLVPGAQLALELIRSKKAALAILDEGASPNTAKKMLDACRHYGVTAAKLPKGFLGQAAGRTGMAAAALKPGGFARQASNLLQDKNLFIETKTAEDKG